MVCLFPTRLGAQGAQSRWFVIARRLSLTQLWQRIPVPNICERMIGFSIPQDDTVLVVSYEGMHLVRLDPPVTVETDEDYFEYDLYEPATGIARYYDRDWQVIGLHPGRPLLTSPQGESLQLDEQAETVSVLVAGEVVWSSSFKNFSGDWAAATFSPDGRFIVLGCPYDFDFRVWQRAGGADAAFRFSKEVSVSTPDQLPHCPAGEVAASLTSYSVGPEPSPEGDRK